MWIERIIEAIQLGSRVVLADSSDGSLDFVARAMLQDNGSTMWLDLNVLDSSDPDVILEYLRLNHWGLPVEVVVGTFATALEVQAQIVADSVQTTFFVTGISKLDSWLLEIIETHKAKTRLVLGCSTTVLQELSNRFYSQIDFTWLEARTMALTRAETTTLLGSEITDEYWQVLLKEGSNTYKALYLKAPEQLLSPNTQLPSATNHANCAVAIANTPRTLSQLFKSNGRWLRALRVAISTGERFDDLLDRAGEEAIAGGSIASFRRSLAALPSELRDTEQVLFWLLLAGSTLPSQPSVVQEVMDYLSKNEAVQLRLLAASLGLISAPQDISLETISKPAMVLHFAHLKAVQGNPDEAVRMLMPAVEQFLNGGREFLYLQAACLLSNALISAGSLEAGAHWASKAIQAVEMNGTNDPHLNAAARSLRLYTLVLLGRIAEASDYLNPDLLSCGYEGLPSMEAVFTSNADYYMLTGNGELAYELYKRVIDGFPSSVSVTTLPEYVTLLLELGRSGEARRVAQEAYDHWSGEGGQGAVSATLSLGVSLSRENPGLAMELLDQVISHARANYNAPRLCRAVIQLAMIKLRNGSETEALKVLSTANRPLTEIGDSGWLLFGGLGSEVLELRKAWIRSKTPITLDFLGASDWRFGPFQMSGDRGLKIKEILFVLSVYPKGLNGEKLYELLDGQTGSTLTLRSHIRNLRQYVPVGTGPYRLLAPVKADFLECEMLIGQGKIAKALDLYKGPLLGQSQVPYIREYAASLESQLRIGVEQEGSSELLTRFALLIGDDLTLLEQALSKEPKNSPARISLTARVEQVRKSWEMED